MKHIFYILIILFTIQCRIIGKDDENEAQLPELLVYCENAMVQPLLELSKEFEESWDCKVIIHNDCSQNLISLIQYSLEGDIYFPASQSGFTQLRERHSSFVTDSVFIGYNPLVMMVEKGNPSEYSGKINSILTKNKAIIIANPETSSLGYETQKILAENDIYDDMIANIVSLSADSRGLIKSISNKEAQLAINWQSDIYKNMNSDIDVISISQSDEDPPKVYVGILSTSQNISLASEFLEYTQSARSEQIFRKYGFSKKKNIIF